MLETFGEEEGADIALGGGGGRADDRSEKEGKTESRKSDKKFKSAFLK